MLAVSLYLISWLGWQYAGHLQELLYDSRQYGVDLTTAWNSCASGESQRIYWDDTTYAEVTCIVTKTNVWGNK